MLGSRLDQVTLAVLAGGEGSRMGKPKAMLEIAGRPILAYLVERFRWPGPTMLVTAPGREKPPGHDLFAREVVDTVTGEGPLRGVLTALQASETEIVVVMTVDMPEIRQEHLTYVVAGLVKRPASLGLMLQRSDQIEPFPCVFRRHAASMISSRLAAGRKSVRSLAATTEIVALSCPDEWPQEIWTNLNDPQELHNWLSRQEKPSSENEPLS